MILMVVQTFWLSEPGMCELEMSCVEDVFQSRGPCFQCRESTAREESTTTSSFANLVRRRSRRLLQVYCPRFISQLVRNFWTIASHTTPFGCGVDIAWKVEVESSGTATSTGRRTSGPLQLLPSTTPSSVTRVMSRQTRNLLRRARAPPSC